MQKSLTITAIAKNGKMSFSEDQLSSIRDYLAKHNGKAVMVSFARPRTTRSLKQNAYLWGVVYTYIAAHTGHDAEDIHVILKDDFLPRKFVTIGNKEREIRKTTADLSPTEFNEYIERCVAWAAQELGLHIPSPHGD